MGIPVKPKIKINVALLNTLSHNNVMGIDPNNLERHQMDKFFKIYFFVGDCVAWFFTLALAAALAAGALAVGVCLVKFWFNFITA